MPIQCTFGKCTVSAHISCVMPDEVLWDDHKWELFPQWMCKSVPSKEAAILNGQAKKPTKKAKATAAKAAKKQATPAVAPASAPAPPQEAAAAELPALTAQPPAADAPPPATTAEAPPAPQTHVQVPVASLLADAPSAPPTNVQAADVPAQADSTAQATTTESQAEPEDDDDVVIVLCPTHNPEWKKHMAERRAAKRMEELRERIFAIAPGTLVKYRVKSTGIWQAPLISVQDGQNGAEGTFTVSLPEGPFTTTWSRLVIEPAEQPPTQSQPQAAADPAAASAPVQAAGFEPEQPQQPLDHMHVQPQAPPQPQMQAALQAHPLWNGPWHAEPAQQPYSLPPHPGYAPSPFPQHATPQYHFGAYPPPGAQVMMHHAPAAPYPATYEHQHLPPLARHAAPAHYQPQHAAVMHNHHAYVEPQPQHLPAHNLFRAAEIFAAARQQQLDHPGAVPPTQPIQQ